MGLAVADSDLQAKLSRRPDPTRFGFGLKKINLWGIERLAWRFHVCNKQQTTLSSVECSNFYEKGSNSGLLQRMYWKLKSERIAMPPYVLRRINFIYTLLFLRKRWCKWGWKFKKETKTDSRSWIWLNWPWVWRGQKVISSEIATWGGCTSGECY